jgi:hypothetical protein
VPERTKKTGIKKNPVTTSYHGNLVQRYKQNYKPLSMPSLIQKKYKFWRGKTKSFIKY